MLAWHDRTRPGAGIGLPPDTHGKTGTTGFSFDDPATRYGARADPTGFVLDLPERAILDEVQHVPELFSAIKMSVDRQRIPGRFLLAGSTNVFLVNRLSDSLAGRMQIVPLHPLSQFELTGGSSPLRPDAGFLEALFGDGFSIFRCERLGDRLAGMIVAGGFPAALARPTPKRQANWYRDYVDALVQRDARDMTRLRSLTYCRDSCAPPPRRAQLFNLSSLAAPFELSRPSIGDYVTLLERLFLLERIPSWHGNRLKRLIRRPKLHVADTGLAAALLGAEGAGGKQNIAGEFAGDLRVPGVAKAGELAGHTNQVLPLPGQGRCRTDIVIEQASGSVAGVEVKAAATVRSTDFRGLHKLERAVGSRFVRGIVLHDGEVSVPFGERFHAVPISRLWNMPSA